MEELFLLEEEGFSGAIIENYHGCADDVIATLVERAKNHKSKFRVGVNILGDSNLSFKLVNNYKADFIQIDSIHPADMSWREYNKLRAHYNNVSVFGGINFKYKTQEKGEGLVRELKRAIPRCEAIVTTGEGTGIETPIEKLKIVRKIIGEDNYLFSGAGVNKNNVCEQLNFADGIIIGSFLKDYDTKKKIIRERCEQIIIEVNS
ncbi:hypothetical protein KAT80_01910 [Candidatus Pacearchaeota archaeon]|nr:hypothetical protein [Candidatus Pacearchaeota archaeon]